MAVVNLMEETMTKTKINVDIKKKTLVSAYNQMKMLSDLDFPAYQKGEPIHDLMMEIKRQVMKQRKQEKVVLWKELLEFWPLSIVVPSMLIAILCANIFQWQGYYNMEMFLLMSGILILGLLVYMIFLSNEMSLTIDRLSIKIIELKNKLKQINRKDG